MTSVLQAANVSEHEIQQIQELARAFDGSVTGVLLLRLASALARGVDVTLLEKDKELTPNEAAEVLGVSRPHLVRLMDRGLLEYRTVGTHRRIAMPDLLDYIERHERANARVANLLATREHARVEVKNNAARLTDDDLAELESLVQ